MAGNALESAPVTVRLKLSALWASLMACFIYGDYFELYQPGKLRGMLSGLTAMGPATEPTLLGFAILLSVPAVMIYLSLVLWPAPCRWMNIALGLVYAVVTALAIIGSWTFYAYLGLIEIGLCSTIVWQAARWPRLPLRQGPHSAPIA